MRIVIQRVTRASVVIEGRVHAAIGPGLLLLVGVEKGDADSTAAAAGEKVALMRIFPVQRGVDDRMDRSIIDVGGEVLVVSQFTLAGSLHRGRRPGFDHAAPPETARPLYEAVAAALARHGLVVKTGVFGAMMEIELTNDGPVTFVLETSS